MSDNWIMSDSIVYESDKLNKQLKFAYWEGHRDFAYDLIQFVKPKQIVELGSQYGCSLFSFCQSVKDNHLNTRINAVDFWKGNIGAVDEGEKVFELIKKTIQFYYSNLNIQLYQMNFDAALSNFENETVDILHIDGGHRYEDVDNDFTRWLPKLKENGIILFHDVFSHIDEGSCIHWSQIKKNYDCFFEFKHSCGLGILFPKGDKWYQKMIAAGYLEKYEKVYYYKALYKYTKNRFDELSGLYEDRYAAIKEQSKLIDERDEIIKAQAQMCEERYDVMQKQSIEIQKKEEIIKTQAELCEERYGVIQQQSEMIAERDETIKAQAQMCEERYGVIQEQSKMIAERDETIKAQAQMCEERYRVMQKQGELLGEKEEIIAEQIKEIKSMKIKMRRNSNWKHKTKMRKQKY